MYGQTKLTPINVLKHGLTKEFFELFSPLKYEGIELPPVLLRYFIQFIRPHVEARFENASYVKAIQEKHQLYEIKDVQKALVRLPEKKKENVLKNENQAIMLTAIFTDFAIDKLQEYPVIIVIINERDRELVKSKILPKNFTVIDFYKEAVKIKIADDVKKKLFLQKRQLLKEFRNHVIFGKQSFQSWFSDNRIHLAMQMIHFMKNVIEKHNVGIIIDHVEVINPSILFGLFAQQYDIPFVLVPQLIFSDRSIIPSRATHYLVWGRHYRDWIAKRGIPLNKITEVGCLRFHYQMQNRIAHTMTKQRFLNVTKIPKQHLVITYTTQPFPFGDNFKFWLLQWIKYSVESLPITVIIRPHPADKYDYRSYIQDVENIIIVPDEKMNLYNLIENSDVVMTISSNTAIEATLMKKGLIILQPSIPSRFDFSDNNIHNYLARGNAGAVAYNKYDLKEHFNKLINDRFYKNSLVRQGQYFLNKTLNLNVTPPTIVKEMIDRILQEGN